ncbi:hypothetical protein ACTIVE_2104, partial [Actinomadura verrucosospora]
MLAGRQPERQVALAAALGGGGAAAARHPHAEPPLLPDGLRVQPVHPALLEDLRRGAQPLAGLGALLGRRVREPGGQVGARGLRPAAGAR